MIIEGVLAQNPASPGYCSDALELRTCTLFVMSSSNWKALFSSATDESPTPRWLFEALSSEFPFTLDPCATPANAKCRRFFTKNDDGLRQDWTGDTVFMNPPYGRTINRWVQKAFESSQEGALVVCLLPSRTDTRWWHAYVMRGEIRLLRGRLTFEGASHPAPFPSAIAIFRPPSFKLLAADR